MLRLYLKMELKFVKFVRLYLLNRLSSIIDRSSVGLYGDDRLPAINKANGPTFDRIRKRYYCIIQGRKDFQSTSKQILQKQIFQMLPSTLRQRNNFLFGRLTIHHSTQRFSNHLPIIIKQLPKMINKRISDLSCNKGEFDKVKSLYE